MNSTSASCEPNRMTLLKRHQIYKVKAADTSLVFDGHSSVDSKPITIQSVGKTHQIFMHQPEWIAFGCATGTLETPGQTSDSIAKVNPKPTNVSGRQHDLSKRQGSNSTDKKKTGASKIISRKKSIPRHRCNQLNNSLTSVLRPSHYTTDTRLTRSLPPNSSAALDTPIVDDERLRNSMSDFNGDLADDEAVEEDECEIRKSLSVDEMPWLPKGVNFNLSVEAYFYRQRK